MPQKKKGNTAARKKSYDETEVRNKEIIGIVVIAVSILLLLNFIIAPQEDSAEISAFGVVSLWFVTALRFLAGHGAIALPVFLLVFGILICAGRGREHSASRLVGIAMMFMAVLGYLQLSSVLLPFKEYLAEACAGNGGGLLGAVLDFVLLKTIGKIGAVILLTAILLIGILQTFQTSLKRIISRIHQECHKVSELAANNNNEKKPSAVKPERCGEKEEAEGKSEGREVEYTAPPLVTAKKPSLFAKVKMAKAEKEQTALNFSDAPAAENDALSEDNFVAPSEKASVQIIENTSDNADPAADEISAFASGNKVEKAVPVRQAPPETEFVRNHMPSISGFNKTADISSFTDQYEPAHKGSADGSGQAAPETADPHTAMPDFGDDADEKMAAPVKAVREEKKKRQNVSAAPFEQPAAGYRLPPVELIDARRQNRNPKLDQAITDNVGVLETTLENFGVKASVTQVVAGPAVTRYELQPAPGVKVARITSLADDIALSLAAQSVRIEAPIPGKSAIGIEIARKERDTVFFREMIESENFKKADSKLTVVLGKNIGGECVVADLTKMPHLLIAGTTGSGKSVCINTIICSILYKAKPDEVKMMLIDPKKVELTTYARLPHLIAPVINDCKKASNALKWIVNEMENRYTLFAANGVKDIKGYTEACPDAPMCKIVVIIDELADLMMVAKRDVEDSICRIAQLARAAGIHLVVATQRPSVDVITGLIKANIPSRIAFTVSSPVDSRTILDCGGAEKLLGNGDMLFDPVGNNKPMRIQGTFINEKDVAKLVNYCADQAAPQFSDEAMQSVANGGKSGGCDNEELDELFYEAGMIIINTGQASTSFLQRRLAIGNPRAARLMDMLEAKGVVGGPNGSKPREILVSLDEFEEMYG